MPFVSPPTNPYSINSRRHGFSLSPIQLSYSSGAKNDMRRHRRGPKNGEKIAHFAPSCNPRPLLASKSAKLWRCFPDIMAMTYSKESRVEAETLNF
jgi:hypothetical protein